MTIRQANIEDLGDLLKLSREAQETHVSEFSQIFRNTPYYEIKGWFISQLEAKDVYVFVASREKEIFGYVVMRLMPDPANPLIHSKGVACIDRICVGQPDRRPDIAKRLIEHAATHAKGKGYDRIELDVWSDNQAAKSAFEKNGFSACCEKMFYQTR
jgi:ribosomal protein S18 acetylase RimI-like enzyme